MPVHSLLKRHGALWVSLAATRRSHELEASEAEAPPLQGASTVRGLIGAPV